MLAALAVVVGLVPAARAEPSLSADLSAHQITLGADVAGRSVTLFGTIDAPGDIVVVVRGPEAEAVVRRGPFGDFWLTAHRITFVGVPDYYAVYASGPLDAIVPPEIQALHQIGLTNLRFQVQPPPPDPTLVESSRLALIAQRQTAGVYASTVGKVGFVNDHLFRAALVFPADAPAGTYFVEALLFRDKALAGGQTMSLVVTQAGGGAVADPGGSNPLLYVGLGALAATIAATGVFVAGARRRRALVQPRP
ncbi:MAG: TIGR02186 family protein, partial [Stellaceae bacterium]